ATSAPRSPTTTTGPAPRAAAAFRVTSGPMPAGQPVVMTTRSLFAFELFRLLVFVIRCSQLVARAPQCFQGKRVTELGSEPPDVDVHRARTTVVAVAPYARQQMIAGEHFAAPLAKIGEQREFFGRQVDGPAA